MLAAEDFALLHSAANLDMKLSQFVRHTGSLRPKTAKNEALTGGGGIAVGAVAGA
jgi:hypothetical protein